MSQGRPTAAAAGAATAPNKGTAIAVDRASAKISRARRRSPGGTSKETSIGSGGIALCQAEREVVPGTTPVAALPKVSGGLLDGSDRCAGQADRRQGAEPAVGSTRSAR